MVNSRSDNGIWSSKIISLNSKFCCELLEHFVKQFTYWNCQKQFSFQVVKGSYPYPWVNYFYFMLLPHYQELQCNHPYQLWCHYEDNDAPCYHGCWYGYLNIFRFNFTVISFVGSKQIRKIFLLKPNH